MSKKSSKRIEVFSMPLGIKINFCEEEGTWHVLVHTMLDWAVVATHCEKYEAEQCVEDLLRWKRGE